MRHKSKSPKHNSYIHWQRRTYYTNLNKENNLFEHDYYNLRFFIGTLLLTREHTVRIAIMELEEMMEEIKAARTYEKRKCRP